MKKMRGILGLPGNCCLLKQEYAPCSQSVRYTFTNITPQCCTSRGTRSRTSATILRRHTGQYCNKRLFCFRKINNSPITAETKRSLAIHTFPTRPATNVTFRYWNSLCSAYNVTSGWNEGTWTLSATLALNSDW